ncbi:MAG: hypothetical protein RMY28_016995 [Nostoc sp. ChiSLP01]|nr:hypothetical protein [Nostoc sp. CmiSLP01]MDZ8282493.1 hypothetical protein [Nostoc sp. ChiSLP01]
MISIYIFIYISSNVAIAVLISLAILAKSKVLGHGVWGIGQR